MGNIFLHQVAERGISREELDYLKDRQTDYVKDRLPNPAEHDSKYPNVYRNKYMVGETITLS